MSTAKQKRFAPPPDDDDDEETAFHSADEGSEPEADDDRSSALQEPAPTPAASHGPANAEPEVTMPAPTAPKDLNTAQKKERTPANKLEVAQKPKPDVKESPQIESPGGDGWDLDDWDAAADDEGGEKNGDSDVDEIMATPSSERPPPFVQQQRPVPGEETFGGGQEKDAAPQKPSSLWGGWGHQLLSLASDSINTLTNTVGKCCLGLCWVAMLLGIGREGSRKIAVADPILPFRRKSHQCLGDRGDQLGRSDS